MYRNAGTNTMCVPAEKGDVDCAGESPCNVHYPCWDLIWHTLYSWGPELSYADRVTKLVGLSTLKREDIKVRSARRVLSLRSQHMFVIVVKGLAYRSKVLAIFFLERGKEKIIIECHKSGPDSMADFTGCMFGLKPTHLYRRVRGGGFSKL